MPVSSGVVQWITPAMSPSPMRRSAQPISRISAISFFVARAVENADVDLFRLHALGLGQRVDVLDGRRIQIDDAVGIARPDRDLVHVAVRRVQQRRRARQWRQNGDGEFGRFFAAHGRAFQRVERDVDLRPVLGADLLADVEHRRLVALALADDDGAVDRQAVQFAPHGVDGGLVGRLLVAAPTHSGCGNGCALCHAGHLQGQEAV